MGWLRAATRELLSLFVDDVAYTIAILAWIGAATIALPYSSIAAGWHAPILFVGCAVILVENVRRAARGRK